MTKKPKQITFGEWQPLEIRVNPLTEKGLNEMLSNYTYDEVNNAMVRKEQKSNKTKDRRGVKVLKP